VQELWFELRLLDIVAKSVQPRAAGRAISKAASFAIDVSFRCEPSTAPSLLGLAAIHYFKRVKDSAGLAPKSRFVAAKPIKGEVGKVGETQKATSELDSGSVGFPPRIGKRFYVADSRGRSCTATCGFGPLEGSVNYLMGIRKQPAVLLIVMQLLSLNLEQSVFHTRSAAQPPQNARQSQHELALDS